MREGWISIQTSKIFSGWHPKLKIFQGGMPNWQNYVHFSDSTAICVVCNGRLAMGGVGSAARDSFAAGGGA